MIFAVSIFKGVFASAAKPARATPSATRATAIVALFAILTIAFSPFHRKIIGKKTPHWNVRSDLAPLCCGAVAAHTLGLALFRQNYFSRLRRCARRNRA